MVSDIKTQEDKTLRQKFQDWLIGTIDGEEYEFSESRLISHKTCCEVHCWEVHVTHFAGFNAFLMQPKTSKEETDTPYSGVNIGTCEGVQAVADTGALRAPVQATALHLCNILAKYL